jgi:vanillin dehydrogenase
MMCAEHLKPVLLELGGKAPLLVLADADLDEAVSAAAFGAFFNQGQICMSTERIIVDESVADEFVTRLARKAETLRAGDPADQTSVLASMVSHEAAAKVQALVDDARAQGARIATGETTEGSIAQATIVDGVTNKMRLYGEESFGPVVAILRVKGDDEAVSVANDSPYGLSAAIFSRDVSRAFQLSSRIHSGICHINGPTVHDEAQMPFGGVGASGYGRFGGKAAIAEFTDLRWITIQNSPRHYPI